MSQAATLFLFIALEARSLAYWTALMSHISGQNFAVALLAPYIFEKVT